MDAAKMLPTYSPHDPSHQTAVDIFKGHWVCAFPDELGIVAGDMPQFNALLDTRVLWASGVYDFDKKRVLELGPLEGYHTKHLCDRGAEVLAVESNDIAYLKCLIAKEILQIPAKFLFGDGFALMRRTSLVYDFIWASGVLYHQNDPLEFLNLACDHCNGLFIWTHYWQEGKVAAGLNFEPSRDATRTIDGFSARYHYHSYGDKPAAFSGGLEPFSMWMERHEIIDFLRKKGFSITLETDFPDVFPGPCMQLVALRA